MSTQNDTGNLDPGNKLSKTFPQRGSQGVVTAVDHVSLSINRVNSSRCWDRSGLWQDNNTPVDSGI